MIELKDLHDKFDSIMAIESNADRQRVLECLVNDVILYLAERVRPYLRHKYPCSEMVVCFCGLSGSLPFSLDGNPAKEICAECKLPRSSDRHTPCDEMCHADCGCHVFRPLSSVLNSPEWRGERHG